MSIRRIRVKMGNGAVVAFDSVQKLGQHYGDLADAFRRSSLSAKTLKEARFLEGKAEAYSAVAWQLLGAGIE